MKTLRKIRKGVSVGLATLFAWMVAGVAFAQTTTPISTPGAPNTGAGGEMTTNLIVLAIAGALAIAGIVYLAHRPSKQQ